MERAGDRIRARAESRRRIGSRGRSRRFVIPRSLLKAASIALLLTGGAVSALPGSPVRRWVAQRWDALTGPAAPSTSQEAPLGSQEVPDTDPRVETIPETAVSIPALAEGVEIWIQDLSSEAELRIVWTDELEAWVYAGEGTRFNREDGRLEALSPPGAVRVEIPRSLQRVVVRVNGSVLLRKVGGELEILAPAQERTPSEILFEIREPTNDGRI